MLGPMTVTGPPEIRAPRGSERSCKGWPQEAALRMLMNNLDPDVAERPADLVVYGGTGKAAWKGTRPSSSSRGSRSGCFGHSLRRLGS